MEDYNSGLYKTFIISWVIWNIKTVIGIIMLTFFISTKEMADMNILGTKLDYLETHYLYWNEGGWIDMLLIPTILTFLSIGVFPFLHLFLLNIRYKRTRIRDHLRIKKLRHELEKRETTTP